MINQIYPPEQRLNKANASNTEAPFLCLHVSVTNGFYVCCLVHRGSTGDSLLLKIFSGIV